jgi:2-oxoglutarate ferredoxin oxidoreductase subunit alpha
MLEAYRMAVRYMTPVVVLSDSYLANSSEPWAIPDVASLTRQTVELHQDPDTFHPYARDSETLARPWAIPGTPGLEHRIGGLSKQNVTGNVSYDPRDNEEMNLVRAEKVARIAREIPPIETDGPDRGDLLVVGWGSTQGAITAAVEEARAGGVAVSSIHLRHLNPFPSNLGEVLGSFERVLVPEINQGQLVMLLRSRFLVDCEAMNKVRGQPFQVEEIRARIEKLARGEG